MEAGQETDYCPAFASAHTDCIIAEDDEVAETFLSQVDRYEFFCNFKLLGRHNFLKTPIIYFISMRKTYSLITDMSFTYAAVLLFFTMPVRDSVMEHDLDWVQRY